MKNNQEKYLKSSANGHNHHIIHIVLHMIGLLLLIGP